LITVRLATLSDTAAITEIHKSHRLNAESPRYDDLTLFERWQQGGPWMSVETCAVHLNRLLAGSGIPLVAEADGEVLAAAEVYEGFEPPPFGHHLNLAVIVTHARHTRKGLASALLEYIVEMARIMKCERITVSHLEGREFYITHGFRHTRSGRRVRIPAQFGRVVYQATDLSDPSPEQIKGWFMPLGRYQSARQEWENLFPHLWAAGIPELLNPATAHLKLAVTGQSAILFMREAGQPGEVDVACWSARPLSNPLYTAIRDRANRDGYHTIISYVMDSELTLLGPDAQQTDYSLDLYELTL
jgi:GNAT superfamily N-acetyltransferase